MNDLYDYFKVLFNAQKIGHAFLIGNTCLDNCKDILEKVLSDFFFEKKITIDNNVDIICITPEGNAISKAQVKSLVNDLSTTSQYSGIKVYIIDGADKLTDNVYNALLKTIKLLMLLRQSHFLLLLLMLLILMIIPKILLKILLFK